ncbi:MAG: DinB family protein [Candidatus Hodarchaeota archaeon]
MMLSAAIEHGTTRKWYGRIIELPGTIARAPSRKQLLQDLQLVLEDHISWLKQNNEAIPVNSDAPILVKEEIAGIPNLGESGGCVALFEFDKQPVTSGKLKYYFRLMTYSRKTLLGFIQPIPQDWLNEQLPDSKRTTLQILAHICNAEEWYKSRLGQQVDERYEEVVGMPMAKLDNLPVLQRLYVVRKGCLSVLEEAIRQKGGAIFTREAYTDFPEELWTASKVLRRYVEHEREHYYSLVKRFQELQSTAGSEDPRNWQQTKNRLMS